MLRPMPAPDSGAPAGAGRSLRLPAKHATPLAPLLQLQLQLQHLVCRPSSSSVTLCPITMSWQQYVDDQLLATKQVKEAVILGHDGNVWATSQDFTVSPEELKKIVGNYNSVDTLAQEGVTLAGTRYQI